MQQDLSGDRANPGFETDFARPAPRVTITPSALTAAIMANETRRIHRLLHIIESCQNGCGVTLEQLAAELRVTARTVYRDIRVLKEARIPCRCDPPSGTYRIDQEFFVRPVEFTVDEALALAALGEHLGRTNQIPFTGAASRAMEKIRGQLPASIRRELQDLTGRVVIRLGHAGGDDQGHDVYEAMRQAIASHRAVECLYEAAHSGKAHAANQPFLFFPYFLLFSQRAWYAIGYHGGRKALRSLRLSRFAAVKPTNHRFNPGPNLTIDTFLGNAWRMMKGATSYEVELWFDQEFADTIEDTHWHKTQDTERQGDGALVFRCTVDGLDEIVWWVLSMGPHCRVRRPRELAERVRTLAEKTATLYQH